MSEFDSEKSANQWAMFLHLSQLLGLVIPIIGLLAPIVMWQMKKDDPVIDAHGKAIVNWIISAIIYAIIFWLLMFVLIGIPLIIILGIISVVFPIIGGVKANNGQVWKYPMSFTLLK